VVNSFFLKKTVRESHHPGQLISGETFMSDSPTTRVSLLVRLPDAGNAEAWAQFVDIYGPVIYRYARSRGFQDADAADLTQEVLHAVSAAMPRFVYDAAQGRFSSWLFTLSQRALIKATQRQSRQPRGTGDTEAQQRLANHPASEEDEKLRWEREYEQRLFEWSADQVRGEVRPATWDAFWATAVEGRKAADVAQVLGLSIVAVYNAKSRVQARLKEMILANRCE
jgi:RNA polymerase sigma factor (sigma-70 family)